MSRLLDRVLDPARRTASPSKATVLPPVSYGALAARLLALARRLGAGPGDCKGAAVAFLYPPGVALRRDSCWG